jgi:hypothetical protein
MSTRTLALFTILALSAATPAGAKPTPEPGGAKQVTAVAGTLHATLFNGQARVRKMSLGKPNGSPDESYTDSSDGKWIVFRAVMSNGTPKPLEMNQFTASIVDADGIAVAAQPDKVRPMGMVSNIPPGGAWKETILFLVPNDFKPAKIVLVSANPKYKAFRITIAPGDAPQ